MLTVPIVPSSPFTDKELAVWRQRLVNLRLAIAEDIKGTQAFSLETLGNEVILTELHDAREMLELIDNAIRKIDCDDPLSFRNL